MDESAPPVGDFLAEIGGLLDGIRGLAVATEIGAAHPGDGRPVMVVPGFMAGDMATTILRRALDAAGYATTGWELGINIGVTRDLLDKVIDRIEALVRRADGRPAALVGWSLGGLIAREVAKLRPDLVERVVTLGSPFSGSRHANHGWRLYEALNGYAVDRPPFEIDLAAKPPCLTIALWSPRDGIVSAPAARGLEGEADVAIEVDCRHLGFAAAPEALEAVLAALARPAAA